MTPLEILSLIAPEFADVPNEVKMFWADTAKNILNERKFRKAANLALALYAAHKMKLAGIGNGVSPIFGNISAVIGVSSYSEGDTSVSLGSNFSQLNQGDAEYALTVYGMQFLDLRRRYIMPICYG